MASGKAAEKGGLREAIARSRDAMSLTAWIILAGGIPVAAIYGSYPALLFVLGIFGLWRLGMRPALDALAGSPARRRCRIRIRITRLGVMACLLVFLFVLMAARWSGNLVYLMTAVLGGAVAWNFFSPRVTFGNMGVKCAAPELLFAGEAFPANVALENRSRALDAYGLIVSGAGADGGGARHISRLRAGGTSKILLWQTLPHRGRHSFPGIEVRTLFPFGLFAASLRTRGSGEVLVLPGLGHINPQAMHRCTGGESEWLVRMRRRHHQGELHSLKQYRDGDNPRHIHWATSARLRELYVQQFERRETESVLLALDAYAPPEVPDAAARRRLRFETAISFAATLAQMLADQNVPFDFVSCCPEPVVKSYDTGPAHLQSVWVALALAAMTPDHPPVELAHAARQSRLTHRGVCYVTPGPCEQRAGDALFPTLETVTVDVSAPEFDELFETRP